MDASSDGVLDRVKSKLAISPSQGWADAPPKMLTTSNNRSRKLYRDSFSRRLHCTRFAERGLAILNFARTLTMGEYARIGSLGVDAAPKAPTAARSDYNVERPFHFIVVVWGDQLTNSFLEYCLPSLL